MANEENLNILKQGIDAWNIWWGREKRYLNRNVGDLSEADFSRADFSGADFNDVNLSKANLSEANLSRADLSRADLSEAILSGANLSGADFSEADLSRADLRGANLTRADLSKADLSKATLISTNLEEANLSDCLIYGIAAWDVSTTGIIQKNLTITLPDQPSITVDNLKVAQFIYLLLNNKEIRDVIDTVTSKLVLILGRFTSERKQILDAIRDELRKMNYSPILFDFEKPNNRDIIETISTLAHMSRFIIADMTDPTSIAHELAYIVPNLPSVPFVPILQRTKREYSMFDSFRSYPWVLPTYSYIDLIDLITSLREKVIEPAEAKVSELQKIKTFKEEKTYQDDE